MTIEAVILNCEKKPKSLLESVRNTWGKHIDYIVLGDPSQRGDNFLSYPEVVENDYNSVWIKYLAFFKRHDFTKDWYLFCDDDTFVDVNKIKNLLSKYDPRKNICIFSKCVLNKDGTDMYGNQTGFLMNTIKGEEAFLPVIHPAGGAGFILSKKTVELIKGYLKNNSKIGYCYKADVAFAFWINKVYPEYIHNDMLFGNNPKHYNHTKEDIKNSITYHYVSPELMYELYNKCYNNE